jgi:hypothetical protein
MTCSSSPSAKTTRFWMAFHTLVDALQRRGDRVAPGRKLLGIGVHVIGFCGGHARVHRSLGDSDGNRRDQARIERHRDDVLRAEAGARALVGRGDLIGHILARQRGQRLGGRRSSSRR